MKCPIDKENISLSFLFTLFLKSQNSYYKHYLKNEEINLQQIPILLKLLNHNYIYQKDIAIDLKIDNGLLTRNIRKLEDLGYVNREEDNENRRQNKISLTDKGRDFTIKLRKVGIKREEEIMKNVSITREELIDLFLEILNNSKEYNEEVMGD
ncbi:MarR family transcriptional regulator [Methanosphaera sp.]|uniref:MarR family winged helix-turn-helix transcriptional regulator n=1 Tax=Methanosphaera sp. TaxID=2666342 RepID=UPI0025EFA708|nr:MarR family transcriptional regulator [Methanosphaera sp.]MEE1116815.1 MarR family transcriptional regulator [Methanosphaera sp.]MEE3324088.1 MarR family transcriptional regulator [Methanosphaera sp.]MEE3418589.1 MarR family transcriptional regulator [Methanosphaera sp.]